MQAQGDVDGPFLHEALQVGDLGTLEDGLRGAVAHVHPAHRVLHVVEVHGRGLLGAGGGDVGHGGSAQVRGQDVLGVGDEQHGRAIHGLCGQGGDKGVRAELDAVVVTPGTSPTWRARGRAAELPRSTTLPPAQALTVLGFAGSVVRLQEIALDTAARVGALCVGARLTARPVHGAFVKVWEKQEKNPRFGPENTPPSLPGEGMRLPPFSKVELERRG